MINKYLIYLRKTGILKDSLYINLDFSFLETVVTFMHLVNTALMHLLQLKTSLILKEVWLAK